MKSAEDSLTEIAQSMLKIVNDNILYAREVHKS